MRIFKSAWFCRFARKEQIDDAMLRDAIARAGNGSVDADLGGGVIKQRIARQGGGKSGGYRCIILFRKEEKAFFVYGFPKSERGNIRPDETAEFKKLAKFYLALSEEQIEIMLKNEDITEVI